MGEWVRARRGYPRPQSGLRRRAAVGCAEDGAPHAATVTAMEAMVAFSLGVTALRSFLDAHPERYRPLAEIAVARLQTSARWVSALTLATTAAGGAEAA